MIIVTCKVAETDETAKRRLLHGRPVSIKATKKRQS